MAKQVVDLGTLVANGSDGDTAREAFTKVNANFTEVYDNIQAATQSVNNKVDKVTGKSLVDDAEITKLSTVQANATQNSADSFLLDRDNHTGYQAVSTITGLQTALDSKADQSSLGTAAFESADSFEKLLTQGAGITIDRTNPEAPVISASGGAGSGDVIGPVSSTSNEVVLFDGVTGKVLKGGGILGNAAFTVSTDYATAVQGAKADTAVQPSALADYTPTSGLGSAAFTESSQYATAVQGAKADTSLQPAAIGASVQAHSANLTSWSGVAPTEKQNTLQSGVNIKTINGETILGAGNIEVEGGGGGRHVLSVSWESSRALIFEGDVPADGQLLSRATYPDAWAQVQTSGLMITDAAWLADPLKRGMYSSGDGSTTFRMPDYNGKSAGTIGAVFLRGDGALSSGVSGTIQNHAFEDHHHALLLGSGAGALLTGANGLGGTVSSSSTGDVTADTRYDEFAQDSKSFVSSASLLAGFQTAEETRPINVTGCWVVKLFGAVVNQGSADAAQLATDLAAMVTRVASLETGSSRTWKSPTRAVSTIYQNTDGLEREITIVLAGTASRTVRVSSDSVTWQTVGETTTVITNHTFTVPHLWYYRVEGGAVVINQWRELSK